MAVFLISLSLPAAETPNNVLPGALQQHLHYLSSPGTEFDIKVRQGESSNSWTNEVLLHYSPSRFGLWRT